MTYFFSSFESGTNGASAVGEFGSTSLGGGTLTYSNAHPGDGALGAAFTQSGTSTCFGTLTGFNSTSITSAFVFFYSGVPTTTTRIWSCQVGGLISFGLQISTAGVLRVVDSANTLVYTFPVTLVAGHKYRVEVDGFSDAALGKIRVRLFDGAQETHLWASIALTNQNTRGGNITSVPLGILTAGAFGSTFYVDSLQVLDGTTARLGPYSLVPGPIRVQLDDGTDTWPYDITQYVGPAGAVISRGREDEYAQVQPSQCTLTLDNIDGRFTPGSAFYPIDVGTPIRVLAVVGAATFPRFTGTVNAWPVEWPTGGDSYASVTITATDLQAKLERMVMQSLLVGDHMSFFPTAASLLETAAICPRPDGYYPMVGDAAAAVRNYSDVTQGYLTENASNASLDSDIDFQYEAMDGPGNYETKVPAFKRTTGCLRHYPMSTPLVKGDFTIGFFFESVETAPTGGSFDYLLVLHSPKDNANLTLIVDQADSGRVKCVQYDNDTGIAVSTLLGGPVMDGLPHHVAVIEDGATRTLYVDGFPADSATINIPSSYAYDYLIGWRWRGSISHFFWGSALNGTPSSAGGQILQLWIDGIFLTADYAAVWIIRALERAGFTDDVFNIPQDPTGDGITNLFPINTEGMAPAEAFRTWAAAEGGLWFVDAAGDITFHGRTHRYDVDAAVTLSADKVGVDTRFALDDQHLVNDASITTRDGKVWNYRDQASVDKYGLYADSVDGSPIANFVRIVGTPTNDAQEAAEARVAYNSTPKPRVSSTTIDVLTLLGQNSQNPADAVSILSVDIGSRITLTGLPAQAPASSVDLFAEGWTETLSITEWSMNVNTSPGDHFRVWKLEDPTYGVLDSTTFVGF